MTGKGESMNSIFVLPLMIFFHIIDDYYLQGILANMKQKSWWQKAAPDPLYKHDYIAALLVHSFSWAFMIMLPTAIADGFSISAAYIAVLVINVAVHAVVDDLKANKRKINLITDQSIHMVQIAVTFVLWICGVI